MAVKIQAYDNKLCIITITTTTIIIIITQYHGDSEQSLLQKLA